MHSPQRGSGPRGGLGVAGDELLAVWRRARPLSRRAVPRGTQGPGRVVPGTPSDPS